ncbi:hypothetical protein PHIM7_70 [Sinorhizobium phage phiM7]|uniref:Uncharacterized protein n=3 Tax=Emdodecavirus TaxID=1980937 RepID=S5MAS6_9CAUD|nr:hypothetical protein AB690_gp076 [Sinorhizobium phage phiM12]YP_009212326.1 hypothetical protein AVT40_gp086 [Sinorhizobium phage phiN3]YP_009601195.1 hypothetical protein FDH46_gp070 [Sinorhizobium phage phiM7]AKF12978.1 hypothetical protein PHIM19_71 [Sinorhizobium phage phiM19]AGR47723.1 hypothetical protein SmphiM12_091 [Sinorhizobium phage phiM12]AKF12618.1 hypothetical protein PHIM7_70 [Sinorhizobium phage phiM7]AKF13350.1 hypothetical protein PHIN3_86 [Sinorhizobium phage phiN3]
MYSVDERTELLEIIVNQHKDAYGFKPRGEAYVRLTKLSLIELRKEAEYLQAAVERAISDDEEREARAVAKFEQLVAETIELGAGNRETAIRWIIQGEGEDDLEFLEYKFGIPYGYLKKAA